MPWAGRRGARGVHGALWVVLQRHSASDRGTRDQSSARVLRKPGRPVDPAAPHGRVGRWEVCVPPRRLDGGGGAHAALWRAHVVIPGGARPAEEYDVEYDEKRELWFKLQEEDRQLSAEIAAVQAQADEVSQDILEQEDLLRRDPLKKQALDLTRAIQSKEAELEELMESTAHLRLSFPEQKKLLLDQVKRDADSIRKMEEEMKELKDEISGYKDRLHEMNTDLAENQAGTQEDNQKKMMDFYRKMQD